MHTHINTCTIKRKKKCDMNDTVRTKRKSVLSKNKMKTNSKHKYK